MFRRALAAAVAAFISVPPAFARQASTEVAVEVPTDGGGMLMLSRSWRFARHFYAGIVGGGGRIDRDFTIGATPGHPELKASARTIVLPFIGPRITLAFPTVALSIGYAAFHARTDLDVHWPGAPTLTGRTSGWGTAIYSPLLELDFYSEKQDLVYGVGIGGFFGTTFADLKAASSVNEIQTNANPIDALTVHVKVLWGDDRSERMQRSEDAEGL